MLLWTVECVSLFEFVVFLFLAIYPGVELLSFRVVLFLYFWGTSIQFCTVVFIQSLSRIQLFVTPWTEPHQTYLPFTVSWSLLKLTSIQSVMLFNCLIFCLPLLLLPSIFPSIRVFSSELALLIRWPKYWSFSFSISPSNEYSGLKNNL